MTPPANAGAAARYDRRWRNLAAQVRQEQHGICANCGHRPRTLDVHHIHPKATHPELAYTRTNVVGLCRQCHNAIDAQRRRGGGSHNTTPTDTRSPSTSVSPRGSRNSGLGVTSRRW